MSFNKENKVSYTELAPSLQALLNRKVDNNDFNTHISSNDIHITSAERSYWNAIEQKAKAYADKKFKDILGDYENQGSNIVGLLNKRVEKDDFDRWKSTLSRVAFSGSYTDLRNLPSGIAFSDTANNANHAVRADSATTANKATNADYATRAGDSTTVGGIRITIGPNPPSNPKENKEIFFNTSTLFVLFYTRGSWHYTGAALR